MSNFYFKSRFSVKFSVKFHIYILHMIVDGTLSFSPHIAFTDLRPDISIFSNKLKRVILIELTFPCVESMEAWYNTKVNKYMPIKSVIEKQWL